MIPLHKVRSYQNKRRWWRRRAGSKLWFEVILSHEGTSFSSPSSPSGKTDRAWPHEDKSVLPVSFF